MIIRMKIKVCTFKRVKTKCGLLNFLLKISISISQGLYIHSYKKLEYDVGYFFI